MIQLSFAQSDRLILPLIDDSEMKNLSKMKSFCGDDIVCQKIYLSRLEKYMKTAMGGGHQSEIDQIIDKIKRSLEDQSFSLDNQSTFMQVLLRPTGNQKTHYAHVLSKALNLIEGKNFFTLSFDLTSPSWANFPKLKDLQMDPSSKDLIVIHFDNIQNMHGIFYPLMEKIAQMPSQEELKALFFHDLDSPSFLNYIQANNEAYQNDYSRYMRDLSDYESGRKAYGLEAPTPPKRKYYDWNEDDAKAYRQWKEFSKSFQMLVRSGLLDDGLVNFDSVIGSKLKELQEQQELAKKLQQELSHVENLGRQGIELARQVELEQIVIYQKNDDLSQYQRNWSLMELQIGEQKRKLVQKITELQRSLQLLPSTVKGISFGKDQRQAHDQRLKLEKSIENLIKLRSKKDEQLSQLESGYHQMYQKLLDLTQKKKVLYEKKELKRQEWLQAKQRVESLQKKMILFGNNDIKAEFYTFMKYWSQAKEIKSQFFEFRNNKAFADLVRKDSFYVLSKSAPFNQVLDDFWTAFNKNPDSFITELRSFINDHVSDAVFNKIFRPDTSRFVFLLTGTDLDFTNDLQAIMDAAKGDFSEVQRTFQTHSFQLMTRQRAQEFSRKNILPFFGSSALMDRNELFLDEVMDTFNLVEKPYGDLFNGLENRDIVRYRIKKRFKLLSEVLFEKKSMSLDDQVNERFPEYQWYQVLRSRFKVHNENKDDYLKVMKASTFEEINHLENEFQTSIPKRYSYDDYVHFSHGKFLMANLIEVDEEVIDKLADFYLDHNIMNRQVFQRLDEVIGVIVSGFEEIATRDDFIPMSVDDVLSGLKPTISLDQSLSDQNQIVVQLSLGNVHGKVQDSDQVQGSKIMKLTFKRDESINKTLGHFSYGQKKNEFHLRPETYQRIKAVEYQASLYYKHETPQYFFELSPSDFWKQLTSTQLNKTIHSDLLANHLIDLKIKMMIFASMTQIPLTKFEMEMREQLLDVILSEFHFLFTVNHKALLDLAKTIDSNPSELVLRLRKDIEYFYKILLSSDVKDSSFDFLSTVKTYFNSTIENEVKPFLTANGGTIDYLQKYVKDSSIENPKQMQHLLIQSLNTYLTHSLGHSEVKFLGQFSLMPLQYPEDSLYKDFIEKLMTTEVQDPLQIRALSLVVMQSFELKHQPYMDRWPGVLASEVFEESIYQGDNLNTAIENAFQCWKLKIPFYSGLDLNSHSINLAKKYLMKAALFDEFLQMQKLIKKYLQKQSDEMINIEALIPKNFHSWIYFDYDKLGNDGLKALIEKESADIERKFGNSKIRSALLSFPQMASEGHPLAQLDVLRDQLFRDFIEGELVLSKQDKILFDQIVPNSRGLSRFKVLRTCQLSLKALF